MAEQSSNEELVDSVATRIAQGKLDRQQRYLALLSAARRARLDANLDTSKLDAVIDQGEDERSRLEHLAGGRITGRKRPKIVSDETCTVYVDECGSHSLKAKEPFKAFALAAVIVPDNEYAGLDRRWRDWKAEYLGSEAKIVHEPDIRDGYGSFSCRGDTARRKRAIEALDAFLTSETFGAVVLVLHREEYVSLHGYTALDDSLPQYPYTMTVDFLAERVAMALQLNYGGAKAKWVMESRGPREDAVVQYEFARLFLDGTSYVSSSWFRQQFFPGIDFRMKPDNVSGLQLADLLARPCAEKVLDPAGTPARWAAFRDRLVRGRETANSIVGFKIVPWNDKYANCWEKAEGTARAIPPAD